MENKIYYIKDGKLVSDAPSNTKAVPIKSPILSVTENGIKAEIIPPKKPEILSQADSELFLLGIKQKFIEPNMNNKSFPANGTLPSIDDGDTLTIACPPQNRIDESGKNNINAAVCKFMTDKGLAKKDDDTSSSADSSGSGSNGSTGGDSGNNASGDTSGSSGNNAGGNAGSGSNGSTGGNAGSGSNGSTGGDSGTTTTTGGSGAISTPLATEEFVKRILTGEISASEAAATIVPELAIYVGSSD